MSIPSVTDAKQEQTVYHDRLDLKVIEATRKVFADYKFEGHELWKLIGPNITVYFFDGSLARPSALKDFALLVYYIFFRDFVYLLQRMGSKKYYSRSGPNPVFIEAISNNFRFVKFWLPVASRFTNQKAVIVTEDDHVIAGQKDKFDILIPYQFHFGEWLRSRIYIVRHLIVWLRKLRRLEKSGLVRPGKRYFLLGKVIYQINMLNKARWLFRKHKPKAFVTTWDWYDIGAAFCNAAKKFDVRTFTFIHAAMGRQSFHELTPLNADYVFSWGRLNTKHLLAHKVPEQAILETGTPKMSKLKNVDPSFIHELKSGLNIPGGKPVVLLPFTYVVTEHWTQDVNYLIEKLPDYYFIIRLHPSARPDSIDNIINKRPNWTLLDNASISLKDSILISDYVIVDSSTAGFDAIFLGRDVIVLDSAPDAKMQDVMLDACEAEAAVFCTDAGEAIRTIQRFHNDPAYQDTIAANREVFISGYITAYGEEAVVNACKAIEAITG